MKTLTRIAIGLVVALSLAGCYESANVTVHKAGQYKGPKDPLLQGQGADRTETLKKRFSMIQTDR